MPEGLLYLFESRPLGEILRDIADIAIVAYIVYRTLLVLKGTRAMQMGVGFAIFGILYIAARFFELATLMDVLSYVAKSAILIAVVVFQNDIRRALVRVGAKAWFSRGQDRQQQVIDDVVAATTELARHRTGALIVFERDANVLEFSKSQGIEVDAKVSPELLVTLFLPEHRNKAHDGALLIREHRIIRVGIFLPMPDEETKILDESYGSRHRAAIGIVDETDAIVVVVSEESGNITLFFPDKSGNHVTVPKLSAETLRDALLGCFGRPSKSKKLISRISAGKGDAKPPPKSTSLVKSSASIRIPDLEGQAPRGRESATQRPSTLTPIPPSTRHVSAALKTSSSARQRVEDKPSSESRDLRTKTPIPASVSKPMASSTSDKTTSTTTDKSPAESRDLRTKTPVPTAVSKPMASGSERNTPVTKPDKDEGPESKARPAAVTKAMTPTELPATTTAALSGEDS